MVMPNNLDRCQLTLVAIRHIPRLRDQIEEATARETKVTSCPANDLQRLVALGAT
jgi:hypothetical protein